jgi:hypothetical protein
MFDRERLITRRQVKQQGGEPSRPEEKQTTAHPAARGLTPTGFKNGAAEGHRCLTGAAWLAVVCRRVLCSRDSRLGHRQTLLDVRVRQVCVHACVYMCVYARVCVCACVCMRVCVRARAPTDPVAPRSEHRPLVGVETALGIDSIARAVAIPRSRLSSPGRRAVKSCRLCVTVFGTFPSLCRGRRKEEGLQPHGVPSDSHSAPPSCNATGPVG